jgi:Arc/MetJ family transcription regulator
MRITVDVPPALMSEAQELLGLKSKAGTVVFALRELVRRRRIEQLKGLVGRVDLDLDLGRSRRRPSTAEAKRSMRRD